MRHDTHTLTTMALTRAPLLGRERNPRQAKTRVTKTIISSCRPVPESTERSIMAVGGRNTSPWTSFQPKFSCTSSWMGCVRVLQLGYRPHEDNSITQCTCNIHSVCVCAPILTVDSALLYRVMSLCSERSRIMPTMADRKRVMSTEVIRLSHWTLFWEADVKM